MDRSTRTVKSGSDLRVCESEWWRSSQIDVTAFPDRTATLLGFSLVVPGTLITAAPTLLASRPGRSFRSYRRTGHGAGLSVSGRSGHISRTGV